jgi:hypothetical protein
LAAPPPPPPTTTTTWTHHTTGETYLGALVSDHSHGGSADVSGSHAADLNIPFFSHVAMLCFGMYTVGTSLRFMRSFAERLGYFCEMTDYDLLTGMIRSLVTGQGYNESL